MMVRMFAHRNFDPATGDVKKAHALVCEVCNQPLWKHHALTCPVDRRSDEAAKEVRDFLRRAEDWPYLGGIGPVEAKTLPPETEVVAHIPDLIVGIVNFKGRIIVAANSGVFELIDNQLHRIPMVTK